MENEIVIRRAQHDDVDAVLELWAKTRSEHASVADRREDIRAVEQHLPDRGARRITALVAYDDPTAASFWEGRRRLPPRPRHRPLCPQSLRKLSESGR